MLVRINGAQITDWQSFHAQCQQAFGFPDFYGCNMNAWIDCFSDLYDPNAGMTSFTLVRGEILTLVLNHAEAFRQRCPEQYMALLECAAFVNARYLVEAGQGVIALAVER